MENQLWVWVLGTPAGENEDVLGYGGQDGSQDQSEKMVTSQGLTLFSVSRSCLIVSMTIPKS